MLLNGIGGRYESQGVAWIAKILKSNGDTFEKGLEENTIYYLNAYMRRYLYRERKNVRRSPELIGYSGAIRHPIPVTSAIAFR